MTAIRSTEGPSIRPSIIGIGIFAIIFTAVLFWSKWAPYTEKALTTSESRTWDGSVIFDASGPAGTAPTVAGAWEFTLAYSSSVWRAAVAGLLIAAAIDALVPRTWLLRFLNRRTGPGQAIAGGLTSLPSMMCTCCAALVTVGMRKRGASTAASLAHWIGNPILNPAVLVFLFLVAPWQFGATRLLVGALLVFGGTILVTRIVSRWKDDAVIGDSAALPSVDDADEQRTLPQILTKFLRSLTRFSLVLIPEYVVIVFLIGLFSSALSDFTSMSVKLGILSVLLVAVVAAMLVIPTGGEIPVVLGLAAAGVGTGTIGALLIALPALSLPSMVMVGRALSWRLTIAAAAAVVAAGVLAGVALGMVWHGI